MYLIRKDANVDTVYFVLEKEDLVGINDNQNNGANADKDIIAQSQYKLFNDRSNNISIDHKAIIHNTNNKKPTINEKTKATVK